MRSLRLAVQEGRFAHSQILRPLSGLWYLGATAKNWLYDRRYLPIERLSVPVVSVGAITAGGSGKTPLVHLLANTLRNYGPVAILSRGYRGGDEAKMLQRRLPDVSVLIGKDRISQGRNAIARGARLLILDDGFQYRCLHRDFELLALSGKNPYGYGAYLPRGLLRDPPSRLKEATAFFSGEPVGMFSVPSICVQMQTRRLLDLRGNEQQSLAGKKIGAYCAIAHPQRFFQTLKDLGAEIIHSWILPDHEMPNMNALASFAAHCRNNGASFLVCTEKDAVKLPRKLSLALPTLYLEMELEVVSGGARWKNLIEKIVLKMNNSTLKNEE